MIELLMNNELVKVWKDVKYYPAFALWYWGKIRKISHTISDLWIHVWTRDLSSTCCLHHQVDRPEYSHLRTHRVKISNPEEVVMIFSRNSQLLCVYKNHRSLLFVKSKAINKVLTAELLKGSKQSEKLFKLSVMPSEDEWWVLRG